MQNKWWEKFFDDNFANFYLKKDEKDLRKISKFLSKYLKLKKDDLLFDQCSGTGDVSLYLAKTIGIRAIGVEQSKDYVETGNRNARSSDLDCKFYTKNADTFVSKKKCDAAINWYTSFGYNEEDKEN